MNRQALQYELLCLIVILSGCRKEHFISDPAYRAEVSRDFQKKREALPAGVAGKSRPLRLQPCVLSVFRHVRSIRLVWQLSRSRRGDAGDRLLHRDQCDRPIRSDSQTQYNVIEQFLRKAPVEQRSKAIALLSVISEKDWCDTPIGLADQMLQVIRKL